MQVFFHLMLSVLSEGSVPVNKPVVTVVVVLAAAVAAVAAAAAAAVVVVVVGGYLRLFV